MTELDHVTSSLSHRTAKQPGNGKEDMGLTEPLRHPEAEKCTLPLCLGYLKRQGLGPVACSTPVCKILGTGAGPQEPSPSWAGTVYLKTLTKTNPGL